MEFNFKQTNSGERKVAEFDFNFESLERKRRKEGRGEGKRVN